MILGPSSGRIGKLIGYCPWVWIVFSTVLFGFATLSLYLKPLKFDVKFDNGYTTPDAGSVGEMRAQVEFFGDRGSPWYMALFAEPKNGNRSVLDSKEFSDIKNFYHYIKKMSLRYDESSGKNISYMDLCGSTCNLNDLLFKTYAMSFFGIEYPVADLFGYKSNIAKHFYNVKTSKSGEIEHSNLTMLVFMVFSDDKQIRDDLKLFENSLLELIDSYNVNPKYFMRFIAHGESGMAGAVREGVQKTTFYLLNGVLLSVVVLFCVFLSFSKMFDRFYCSRTPLLWFMGMLTPICAFITSLAFYNFLGYTFTTVTGFTPFLALIYAYDTVILLSHTWLSDSELRRDSPAEHLLEVFATCMPSIIVTAMPSIGFFACSIFPIPNYAALSVMIGLILVFTVFYTMFLFAPSLPYFAPAAPFLQLPQSSSQARREKDCVVMKTRSMEVFCDEIATSKVIKIVGILGFIVLVVIPVVIGCHRIKGNLDYRQLLWPGSPRNEGVHLMSDVVWPQYFSVMFFINNPPDFSNPTQYGTYKDMIAEISEIQNKLPESTDMTWIKDFCRHTKTDLSNPFLNMTFFKSFIEDPIYKSWGDGVKFSFDDNGIPTIHKMLHIVSFNGTRSLADKADLFQKCRQVADKYPQFSVYPFDTEVGFADIITQGIAVVTVIPMVALVSMFVGSVIIFSNLSVAILNFLLSLLIYGACIAIPTFLGTFINPFTTAYLLCVAALVPKFTTHFCYFYQQAKRINSKAERKERLHETLHKSFLPVIMSFMCSASLFIPVLAAPVTIFREVALINTCFVIYGFVISFFFLQLCLNSLPETLTGTHFLLTPKH